MDMTNGGNDGTIKITTNGSSDVVKSIIKKIKQLELTSKQMHDGLSCAECNEFNNYAHISAMNAGMGYRYEDGSLVV